MISLFNMHKVFWYLGEMSVKSCVICIGNSEGQRYCRVVNVSREQELKSNLFSSRQMMEDHGDKPFGMMERLTREKEEAARKLKEEQDQREKEEEERRMKEMLCKQNEGPGSASSSRQRIRAILEKQKKQRVST